MHFMIRKVIVLKKLICTALLISFTVITFCSCSRPEFGEVNYDGLPKVVRAFFDKYADKNGVFLYANAVDKLDSYLMINISVAVQGESNESISDVTYQLEDDTLKVFYTTETADQKTGTANRVFYRITEECNLFLLYKDGIETPFDLVGS